MGLRTVASAVPALLIVSLLGCSSGKATTSPATSRQRTTTSTHATSTTAITSTTGVAPTSRPASTIPPTTTTALPTTTVPLTTTTAPVLTTTRPPAPATTTRPVNGRAAALAKLASLGWESASEAGSFGAGSLSAFGAHHQGSINGRCNYVFFFLGGRYLGMDATECSDLAIAVSSDGNTVRVEYPLYQDNDVGCCPSGGHSFVRFHWNGRQLLPLDPIPPLTGPRRRCFACD